MNTEAPPTKLLKITERFHIRTIYTNRQDTDQARRSLLRQPARGTL
jgi:hypothetical protein